MAIAVSQWVDLPNLRFSKTGSRGRLVDVERQTRRGELIALAVVVMKINFYEAAERKRWFEEDFTIEAFAVLSNLYKFNPESRPPLLHGLFSTIYHPRSTEPAILLGFRRNSAGSCWLAYSWRDRRCAAATKSLASSRSRMESCTARPVPWCRTSAR